MKVDLSREIALKILYEIHEKGAYSNIELNKQLGNERLSQLDKGFITEIVYGTEKWILKIDWLISRFSKIKLKKISPWILNIMRLSIYQILFMDKIPVSAAVNEGVKLARKYGHKSSAGFANAILRKISRMLENNESLPWPEKGRGTNSDKASLIKYLSIMYSHPDWMVERFIDLFGEEFTESLLDANNKVPEMTVRVNTLKIPRDELIKQLKDEGVSAKKGEFCEDALILQNPSSITRLKSFKTGLFQVQDESSMLAVKLLDPLSGEFILDVCSAPGGKSTYAAQLMQNKGRVLARDIYQHKLDLIDESAERLGLEIIDTEIFDAVEPDPLLVGKADRVIIDAPCSGLGIIRRKPDIKWTKQPEDIAEITSLQYEILKTASQYVKPGGVLVYSTCTILPEENEEQILKFLSAGAGVDSSPGSVAEQAVEFYQDDIRELLPPGLAERVSADKPGMLQLYPNRDGLDGFFIARLRRSNS
jgi:16S rRNA (cytosine967-C5)-methyltransferase